MHHDIVQLTADYVYDAVVIHRVNDFGGFNIHNLTFL